MSTARIGLIGLGTMGANLALNIAEKGFDVAVWTRRAEVTRKFHSGAGALAERIVPTETLDALVAAIAPPRAIILMVPAGDPVDQMIAALEPLLDPRDIIIDAGNANFRDTERRAKAFRAAGRQFLGVGVSGGAEGARHGPSIMGGGDRSAWESVRDVMEAIAARYEGEPCAAWLGPGGAGHFVKTVHNGIEYADMQLIAESYGLMRDGLGLDPGEMAEIFARWNEGALKSYLIEISAEICRTEDPETGRPILDVIEDRAGQKGTGRWTVIEAQHLGVPVTVIDAAVAARNISAMKERRSAGEATFGAAPQAMSSLAIDGIEQALTAGKILCYSQGFDLLTAASAHHAWDLPLPTIARIWRAGCIIRSAMLDDMARALSDASERPLMLADTFAARLAGSHGALRAVSATALEHGHPVPSFAAALGYFDAMRTSRGTANMIQAQRDFFGAHGFRRTDRPGDGFHGPWVREG